MNSKPRYPNSFLDIFPHKYQRPTTNKISHHAPIKSLNFSSTKPQDPKIKILDLTPHNPPIDLTAPSVFKVNISTKSNQSDRDNTKPRFISPSHLSSSSSRSDSVRWGTEQIVNQNDTSNNDSPRARIVFSSEIPTKDWAYDFRTDETSPCNNVHTTAATNQNFGQGNTMIHSVVSNYDKNDKENEEKNKEAWTPRNYDLETKEGTDASQRSPLRLAKWRKLKSVFMSLLLFQREEVTKIRSVNAISQEVNKFTLRQRKKGELPYTVENPKEDATRDALDLIRRVQKLTECATIGSPAHISEMKSIIQADPKRYMRSPEDHDHLLNYRNGNGQTPMYVAAKHGNLEVIKLLVDNNAGCQIKSRINISESYEETPLEVAVRWGHISVVNYFLESFKWDTKTIKKCQKLASNLSMKSTIKNHLKHNKINKKRSIFVCSRF